MKNIELKAKYENLDEAEQIAKQIGATFQWVRRQMDTYFKVPRGRLKLREVEGREAELIGYFRENRAVSRESDYSILTVDEAELLKNMLARNLGVLVVVEKIRKLYLIENVRIHLDRVEQLGNFLEFEGVLKQDSQKEDTRKRLDALIKRFKIKKSTLVQYSYSDLLSANLKISDSKSTEYEAAF